MQAVEVRAQQPAEQLLTERRPEVPASVLEVEHMREPQLPLGQRGATWSRLGVELNAPSDVQMKLASRRCC